jgi:potassium/chloride transporter 9
MLICLVGAALFAKTSVIIFVIVIISTLSVIISLLGQHSMPVSVPDENDYFRKHFNSSLEFTSFKWSTFKNNVNRMYLSKQDSLISCFMS